MGMTTLGRTIAFVCVAIAVQTVTGATTGVQRVDWLDVVGMSVFAAVLATKD